MDLSLLLWFVAGLVVSVLVGQLGLIVDTVSDAIYRIKFHREVRYWARVDGKR